MSSLARKPIHKPSMFRSLRPLGGLNVVGVGAVIAAIASEVFLAAGWFVTPQSAAILAVPTFAFACAWMALLRWKRRAADTNVRVGWYFSAPLALANAMLVNVVFHLVSGDIQGYRDALDHAFTAATLGGLLWVPGLLLAVVVFGLPLLWAQELARTGVVGEERGERTLAQISFALAAASAICLGASRPSTELWEAGAPFVPLGFAAVAMLTAGAAAAVTLRRELHRRRFVERAAASELAGYRVDTTAQGRVLVRIEPRAEGYRVADVEEDVALVDAEGAAKRVLR